MPLYEYTCRGCGRRFEVLQRFILNPPGAGDYEQAALRLGIKAGLVRKNVCDLREAFYDALRREVAQTAPRDEVDAELRYVVTTLGRLLAD